MTRPAAVPTPPLPSSLDAILALQLSVAWAGEGRSEPPRLGWWQTDLVAREGGGDLLERLLPRTHAWAAFESVVEAGRRVDAAARREHKEPDHFLTLFHLGFDLDEQLRERLTFHKRQGATPHAALPGLIDTNQPFSRDGFAVFLSAATPPKVSVIPGGRELLADLPAPELRVRHLAAALVPFAEQYPLPFFRASA